MEKFQAAAAAKGIRVFRDLGGTYISRETEVGGRIYYHSVEIDEQDVSPSHWDEAFEKLDRRFASLLAAEGIIPLPPEFGGAG